LRPARTARCHAGDGLVETIGGAAVGISSSTMAPLGEAGNGEARSAKGFMPNGMLHGFEKF
jgi:hypothetical protein